MARLPILAFALALAASPALSFALPAPSLMPLPQKLESASGALALDSGFGIKLEGGGPLAQQAVARFSQTLAHQTSLKINGKKHLLVIHVGSDVPSVVGADESYKLAVTPSGINIEAPNDLALMRALATLRQLVVEERGHFALAATSIEDRPTFAWRGLMIDPARHFLPISLLKRNIDAMELTKLNVLHLHLSDNEGFRIESKVLPALTGKGSEGQFYTQNEMRELIRYAAERGVEIVPEFDMPSHCLSWLAGYPEISSSKGNFEPGPMRYEGMTPQSTLADLNYFENHAGIPTMDPTREVTYELIDKLIAEMASLFPSPYIHIGADENNGVIWIKNPEIAAYMKEHGYADAPALQAYFVGRVKQIVERHGKKMAGWEEAYAGEQSSNTLFEVWSMEPKSDLTKVPMSHGNHIIIANGFYLDIYFPAHVHYLNPVMAKDATAANAPWGGEGAIWTEMVDPTNFDTRVWPRMGVIAERLWTGGNNLDADRMYPRMFALNRQLASEAGLTSISFYQEKVREAAKGGSTAPIETLLGTLAQLTGYQRNAAQVLRSIQTGNWKQSFNRVSDYLPIDSESRYSFRMAVQSYLATSSKPAEEQLRQTLKLWAGEEEALKPYLGKGSTIDEVAPHAKTLSALSRAALEALDSYDHSAELTAAQKEQSEALLKAAKEKYGETQIALEPEFRALFTRHLDPQTGVYPIE